MAKLCVCVWDDVRWDDLRLPAAMKPLKRTWVTLSLPSSSSSSPSSPWLRVLWWLSLWMMFLLLFSCLSYWILLTPFLLLRLLLFFFFSFFWSLALPMLKLLPMTLSTMLRDYTRKGCRECKSLVLISMLQVAIRPLNAPLSPSCSSLSRQPAWWYCQDKAAQK